jgi:RecA/RadA recombinase
MFAIAMIAGFLKKYPDGVCLFYNNEFGSPNGYFEAFGVDRERVLETPFMHVEELKHDMIVQLEAVSDKEHIIIAVDSIGMAASLKEIEDAKKGDPKAEMTRAKAFKALWRMITPYLKRKNIPLVSVNHTYQTQEMYSKTQVGGGTGGIYSADTILVIGKQQETEELKVVKENGKVGTKKTHVGSSFIVNMEKSRFVKERMKIPVVVTHQDFIHKWSGLFDIAVELGYIVVPKQGTYNLIDKTTGEVLKESFKRKSVENSSEFWNFVFDKTDFKASVKNHFALTMSNMKIHDDIEGDDDFEDEDTTDLD